MTNSKKIGIVILAIIVVVIGVIVAVSSTPNFDTIIENRDCGAVNALTDSDMEKATANQQLKLTILLGQCAFK